MCTAIYLNPITEKTPASLFWGRTAVEVCLCIFEHALISVILEMARSWVLRAAWTGKLMGPTRESPEQRNLVLYKQLVPPRTPLLSNNAGLCSVAPLPHPPTTVTLKHPASLAISIEIPMFLFFWILTPAPWLWPNGCRLQGSHSKWEGDLCSVVVIAG